MNGNGIMTVLGCISFPSFVGCSYRGSGTSYTAGGLRTCSFLTLLWDPRSLWTGTAFIAPFTGYYLVKFSVYVELGSYVMRVVRSDGATVGYNERQGGGTPQRYMHPYCATIVLMSSGQSLTLGVQPISVTSCATNTDDYMYVAFLGASL